MRLSGLVKNLLLQEKQLEEAESKLMLVSDLRGDAHRALSKVIPCDSVCTVTVNNKVYAVIKDENCNMTIKEVLDLV